MMLFVKVQNILFAVVLLLWANNCLANAGVFSGSGHTIELTSTSTIQMVSEEVTIIPHLMENSQEEDAYSAGIGNVEYNCVFHLKNLGNEEQTIQVGFPLNSESIEMGFYKDVEPDDVVKEYAFLAKVDGQQHDVRYVAGDIKNNLKHLFLWDMAFKHGESKTLEVSYSMPVSIGIGPTDMGGEPDYGNEMFNALTGCVSEHFGYVTETGKSWAGPIEKATFRVYLEEIEKMLLNRPTMKSMKIPRDPLYDEEYDTMPANPVVFRYMDPSGWIKDDDGFLTLTIENYEPEQNLFFAYMFLFSFQRTLDDIRQIKLFLLENNLCDNKNCKDYVDILKEFNGINTGNERIQSFLKNQVWYGKEKIQYVPDDVIKALETNNRKWKYGLFAVFIIVGVLFFWRKTQKPATIEDRK